MHQLLKSTAQKARQVSPSLFYLVQYRRAAIKMSKDRQTRDQSFDQFLASCADEPCLQIGVKDSIGKKFGPNWVSVDKYDERDFIDYQYDIHDLQFEDNTFSGVTCLSILEHIPYPEKAIQEMTRVLKPGGHIWVQLPFQYPYHEAPKDYWRVSPDGLRIWMSGYDEIACGAYQWSQTSLVIATYYCGTKQY